MNDMKSQLKIANENLKLQQKTINNLNVLKYIYRMKNYH